MRVCKSPEDAEIEAARAALLAKRPEPTTKPAIKKVLVELRNENCDLLYVSPLRVRLHAKIPAYETWAITYDEGGNEAFRASLNGEEVAVPVSFRIRTVQIYEADFVRREDGRIFKRWIELPGTPYSIDFFNKRRSRD